MSATTLAQYEPYLKSLEDCFKQIDNQYLEIREYIRISHKHLHTMQENIWDVDNAINHYQTIVFMIKALVDELRSTPLNSKERIL